MKLGVWYFKSDRICFIVFHILFDLNCILFLNNEINVLALLYFFKLCYVKSRLIGSEKTN